MFKRINDLKNLEKDVFPLLDFGNLSCLVIPDEE